MYAARTTIFSLRLLEAATLNTVLRSQTENPPPLRSPIPTSGSTLTDLHEPSEPLRVDELIERGVQVLLRRVVVKQTEPAVLPDSYRRRRQALLHLKHPRGGGGGSQLSGTAPHRTGSRNGPIHSWCRGRKPSNHSEKFVRIERCQLIWSVKPV